MLAALAGDTDRGLIKLNIEDAQSGSFASAHAGRVDHFENSPVTQAAPVRKVRLSEKLFYFSIGKYRAHDNRRFRNFEFSGRVLEEIAVLFEIPAEQRGGTECALDG